MTLHLLIINPGSTSTKLSIFLNREEVWNESIENSGKELNRFEKHIEQLEWWEGIIREILRQIGMEITQFCAVVYQNFSGADNLMH